MAAKHHDDLSSPVHAETSTVTPIVVEVAAEVDMTWIVAENTNFAVMTKNEAKIAAKVLLAKIRAIMSIKVTDEVLLTKIAAVKEAQAGAKGTVEKAHLIRSAREAVSQMEQSCSRFGIILPTHARERYFEPSLRVRMTDCFEELTNARSQFGQVRVIVWHTTLAFLSALDSLRMAIQCRLANELAWVAGKLSKP